MATKIPASDDIAWPGAAGSAVDAQGECRFGDARAEAAAALSGDVIVPLTQLGAIRASGADAETFLQNQLSGDVRALTADAAQLSSYSSPKGRVLALFTLFRAGDAIVLELRRELLAAALKRLRMYVLRSKLSLDDASGALPALGLAGAGAAGLLGAAGLPVPPSDWGCARDGEVLVMRRPGAVPRYSVHGPGERLAALWAACSAHARPAGSAAWRLLDIGAGLPSIRPATADQFVPQMLNLDRLGAISFTKGCYPGQEIVARLHYLGNLKRRMFGGHCAAGEPAAGMPVHAAGGDGQPVGSIVEAAPDAQGGYALLAVLSLGLDPGADLRLGAVDGAALKFDWSEVV
ncbi:MAG: folate-binding protein YgfZ [Nevskia sp.]|nr:folate-binding protein YgfZ [Nevskia sp.]